MLTSKQSPRILLLHMSFAAAWVFLFFVPLRETLFLSLKYATYSHIIAVPLISAFFFFTDRKEIFSSDGISVGRFIFGLSVLITGLIALAIYRFSSESLSPNDQLSLAIFASVLVLWGYCLSAIKNLSLGTALFPGLFLLLAVPIPDLVRETVITYLIAGSTVVTEAMFRIARVPYFREGVTFQLPGIAIEIAKECSGIRSSIGMLITGLIASHMFLKRIWTKTLLVVSIIPFVLIKNGIRITTLTLLAVYVDKSYLTDSFLHKSGGVVFFAITLLLMFPVLIYLRRLEYKNDKGIKPGTTLFKKSPV